MKKQTVYLLTVALIIALFGISGCKKDSSTNPDVPKVPTYPVSVTVLNPQGTPQGGVDVVLLDKPYEDPGFKSVTDVNGQATIQSPAGTHTIVAQIGVFQSTVQVNVQASSTPTVAGQMKLAQVLSLGKILIVQASAEQLEDVLHIIGYNTFDSVYVSTLVDSSNTGDTTALLNYLKQYSIIFSDCDGGSEYDYKALARVYGRYVTAGGKIYGGHYNYYHLQTIWNGFYVKPDYQGSTSTDTLLVTDIGLSSSVGATVLSWKNGTDGRKLSGYEKFSDTPVSSKIYGVIKNTSPAVPVIVENYVGTGKYIWTDYHNQDIKGDNQLIKLVQYFLYHM